ncbi:MAG TPA: asparagine synthase-related protein [Candidatus Nanoarchaeia archaeon]|nr:asparagine synthase-related protein [Candidatus Nanoarchaeia archaeon]
MNEEEWKKHIDELRRKTVPSIKEEVKQALINAVEKRVPKERFGLFLSGGVDSSLLALLLKKFTDNFVCYSVGIKGSKDLEGAKVAAEKLKLNWKHKEFTIEEVEELLKKTAAMFEKPDVINVGVGSVVVAAAELADVKTFFGGLGSEEIFAGYQRHAHANDVNDECWKGLKEMWQRDLARDTAIGKKLGIEFLTPFLDDELIVKAMGIKGELKINKEHKKVILREIAEELGLPKEIAWRQKQAAQYGSGFDKAMEKLAKQKGMGKSEYVRNLKTS